MLTADLVRAYRRGDRLYLRQLKPDEELCALDLAERYIALTRACVGKTRGELDDSLASVHVPARHRRLALGLQKLLADRCSFEVDDGHDPVALRREVFERAAATRRALGDDEVFDRAAVLAASAAELDSDPEALERWLYVDLRSAHRLLEFTAPGPAPEQQQPQQAAEQATEQAPEQAPEQATKQAVEPPAQPRLPGAEAEAGQVDGFSLGARRLVDEYVTGQAQAMLLRAVSVRAHVISRSPAVYRALFHKLKFLQLLARIEPGPPAPASDDDNSPRSALAAPSPTGKRGKHKKAGKRKKAAAQGAAGDGYTLHIDGPFSLFRSVTKYGLKLALLLPALQACEAWAIEAEVAWGKSKRPARFVLSSDTAPAPRAPLTGPPGSAAEDATAGDVAATSRTGLTPGAGAAESPLAPAVATLLERFATQGGPWQPTPSDEILHLPGAGLCVPDLLFTHADTGECIYFEVLGFWSRQAVWRRIELIEAGLPYRILFAVSSRLRVSEAALGDELPGALYVYKGVMSARAVASHLDRMAGRDRSTGAR